MQLIHDSNFWTKKSLYKLKKLVNVKVKEGIKNILNEFPKRLGLNKIRILKLLNKLGNPHKCLPPVIHIAGTNGKGSTSAFIKAGLESRGDKVHVFTSPHLINITERILIAGEQIDKKYFNFLLNKS